MSRPEDLLETLGRLPIPAESAEQAAERRERVLSHLEQFEHQLAQKARARGRRRRAAVVFAAFACGAAAALALPNLRSVMAPARHVPLRLVSGQLETGPQGLRSAEGGFQVSMGQKLRAAGAGTRVGVDGNTTLDLGAAAELSFTGETGRRIVELHHGSIRLAVEPLGASSSLAVRTSDATVTVHGTRFSVTTGDSSPACTTVVLDQGVVSVDSGKRHVLLRAPATWSSCAAPVNAERAPTTKPALPPSAVPAQPAAPASEPPPHSERKAALRLAPEAQTKAPASSSLADENALLAAARKAALDGDDTTAVSRLERLLRLYPRSILAQNASVERFRSLKRLGRDGDARNAAARYLSEYPDGFARDEARALARAHP